jgi:thioredoxin reductase (NADPH)
MTPELLIVGAGPAGTSAALWARSMGVSVRVLESGPSAGGQLRQIHFVPSNLAGVAAIPGPELADRLGEQLAGADIEVHYDTVTTALEPGVPAVRCSSGARYEARALLIATGVRRRHLDVPGERELDGRGVSYSATQDRARFAGEDVLVVGGGDAAFENALLLADVGCRVTLAVRGTPRARAAFQERVAANRRIEVLESARVIGIEGRNRVESARLETSRGVFELPVAAVVIKVGVVPNTEWCAGALERDPEGYVLVDDQLGTSAPRVWAAGDVARPPLLGFAVAAGQGAMAVAHISATLREA